MKIINDLNINNFLKLLIYLFFHLFIYYIFIIYLLIYHLFIYFTKMNSNLKI